MKKLSCQAERNGKEYDNGSHTNSSETTTTASVELHAMVTDHDAAAAAAVDEPIQDAASMLVKQTLENAVEKLAMKVSDSAEVADKTIKETASMLVRTSLENAVEEVATDVAETSDEKTAAMLVKTSLGNAVEEILKGKAEEVPEIKETAAVVLAETTLANAIEEESVSDGSEIAEISDQKTVAMLVKTSLANAVKLITTKEAPQIYSTDQQLLRDTAVVMVRNSLENAVVASENDIIGEEEINNDTVEGNSAIVRFEETMLEEEENPDNETKTQEE